MKEPFPSASSFPRSTHFPQACVWSSFQASLPVEGRGGDDGEGPATSVWPRGSEAGGLGPSPPRHRPPGPPPWAQPGGGQRQQNPLSSIPRVSGVSRGAYQVGTSVYLLFIFNKSMGRELVLHGAEILVMGIRRHAGHRGVTRQKACLPSPSPAHTEAGTRDSPGPLHTLAVRGLTEGKQASSTASDVVTGGHSAPGGARISCSQPRAPAKSPRHCLGVPGASTTSSCSLRPAG